MKKQLTVFLLSVLLLSGCASGRMGNPGAIVTVVIVALLLAIL